MEFDKGPIPRHFTVTAYILNDSKVLLLEHPKLKKWLPPGGHLELNETPIEGIKREVFEETGLEIELIRQENIWLDCYNAASIERPYLCLLENIPPHHNTPAHQHIDLIYLARPIGGELKGAKWFAWDEVERLVTDQEIFGETKSTIQHILQSHA